MDIILSFLLTCGSLNKGHNESIGNIYIDTSAVADPEFPVGRGPPIPDVTAKQPYSQLSTEREPPNYIVLHNFS